MNLAVFGIDHRHAFGMLAGVQAAGVAAKGFWTEGDPNTLDGFTTRFPEVPRVTDRRALLDDPIVDLVLIADVRARRAALAIEAMRAGKDVMVDKPGCTTLAQLAEIRAVAERLVGEGAIGKVIQTAGFGPDRLNRATRPNWFFDPAAYGGILCDIASHQIDQFLHFTGTQSAEVISSSVGNYANPSDPGLEDFGKIEPLRCFERRTADVANRTETTMTQSHCFRVMELALDAQRQATRLGHVKQAD